MGNRLKERTKDAPKGLLRFGEKPIIQESIEKLLGTGIKEIILPERNRKDLYDIPAKTKKKLKFHFARNVDQVLKLALAQ